jgi:hypothetical protein
MKRISVKSIFLIGVLIFGGFLFPLKASAKLKLKPADSNKVIDLTRINTSYSDFSLTLQGKSPSKMRGDLKIKSNEDYSALVSIAIPTPTSQLPDSVTNNANGNWQSSVINDLATAITDNFKQQLISVFFDRVQKFLTDPVSVDGVPVTYEGDNGSVTFSFQTLLPNTYAALGSANIVPINSILSYYRNDFATDLSKMPNVLINDVFPWCVERIQSKLVNDKNNKDLQNRYKQIQDAIARAVSITGNLPSGTIPPDQIISLLSAGASVLNAVDPNNGVSGPMVQYGALLVEVVVAQNADDIQAAINNVILPAGSYAKKNTHSLFINSYVGISYDKEYLNANNTWDNSLGGYAPVGIEWEFDKQYPRLFWQVFDLGALVSYQLNGSTSTPSVGFQQVFSPGLFFISNFGVEPLAFGIGGAISPQLRTVTVNGNTLGTTDFRLGAFIAMDIPLVFLQ